jgi:ribonuclease PH
VLDLPYVEDSTADVDMNVVMLRHAGGGEPEFVEVQGTAEAAPFGRAQLNALLDLGQAGIEQIMALQAEMVAEPPPPRR